MPWRSEILRVLARKCEFPGTLVFDPCSSAEASRRVHAFECDFAVSHVQTPHASLVSRKLFTSEYALHIPEGFLQGVPFLDAFTSGGKLPSVGHPVWSWLAELPCLSYARDHPSLRAFEECSGLRAESLRFSVLCQDWDVIADLVARGRGFAILPGGLLDPPPGTRHWQLARGGRHRKIFALHYRKETARSPAGRALLGLVLSWRTHSSES